MNRENRRAGAPGGKRASQRPGSVRIIGGTWRGRRLPVPAVSGLRPTGDRIRETLFNWLAPQLPGARCLDLFAGSGALGLEALSRGAAHCDFVDTQAVALRSLRETVAALGAGDRATVHARDALAFLGAATTAWDIVFLDPPFASGLLVTAIAALAGGPALADEGMVYLEHAVGDGLEVPPTLAPHRQRRTPTLVYALYRRSGDGSARL